MLCTYCNKRKFHWLDKILTPNDGGWVEFGETENLKVLCGTCQKEIDSKIGYGCEDDSLDIEEANEMNWQEKLDWVKDTDSRDIDPY